MTAFAITGIGVIGPGFACWDDCAQVLRGERPYEPAAAAIAAPPILSPRERRRASPTVRLALGAARQAAEQAGQRAGDLPAVFGSCHGEGKVTHNLLNALTSPDPVLSPTQFHNSVHNTAAGYWAIAHSSQAPCDSVSGGDYSFAAALLIAAAQVVCERRAVLVVAYDAALPEPMNAKRPMTGAFGAAMVLDQRGAEGAVCEVQCVPAAPGAEWATVSNSALNTLAAENPSARSLAMLEPISRGERRAVVLGCAPGAFHEWTVTPC
ncbi:MAG TPA: beta-ketoacyl synthase chain length factor [Alphaproteobacteria bacterium]|nr:beta-ketoacyl synthase chain length factor [Alphaproteobacteria bacterium]